MLCQFSFKNYKAFKEEATLDMIAESISEYKESLIIDKGDNEKFLPVAVLYGPNGGGKSTILEALNFLRLYVLQTVIFMKLGNEREKYASVINQFSLDITEDKYFKFDPKCEDMPTSFDVMFRIDGIQYKYQLALRKNVIVEENLYLQNIGQQDVEVVFERSEEECILGDEIEDIAVERVNERMPLLSHIAINYDIEVIDKAVQWFLNIDSVNYDNPEKERKLLIPKKEENVRKMFAMLQEMDIPIEKIRLVKDIDGNITNIYTKHILSDGKTGEIPFEEESSGTRKLFSFLAGCISCLEDGNLIIADELDAKLHPKLLQYIIELFVNHSTNKNGAQLLFTSHDIVTMTPDLFRRDEIWFCARNPLGASKLYSLVSFRKENGFKPRNDEAYGKRYMEGHYGADPYIRRILEWGEDNESETEEIQ